ncbi:methylated-DNA--protein-cysteine methyltransferase isoform X2 [Myotis myotis]|uniref:methylated-DNA--protein-cysteine methyltransferase isoform X2 n=1 Tax=Myotis myotis TaxID=51298 RepID=UPI0017490DFF|nr:methylated-DNA--protein-cysteine methyltransferase isoform X2 [Myotis myotis]
MPRQPWLPDHLAPLRSQLLRSAPWAWVRGRMDAACEVKHRVVASPVGQLRISGCEQGLHGISLLGGTPAAAGPTEAPAPPEPLGSPEETVRPLMECAAWLDAYFQEPTALQELPVPALHHPVFLQDSFTGRVLWKLLKAVKFGEVVSYQQLAALAGNPKAARAVGGAMRSNPAGSLCRRFFHEPSVSAETMLWNPRNANDTPRVPRVCASSLPNVGRSARRC